MPDPSGDERFFFFFAAALTVVGGINFLKTILRRPPIGSARTALKLLLPAAIACMLMIYAVYSKWADPQIRGDNFYTLLFLLGGSAWLVAFRVAMSALGVSIAGDVVEHGNTAAAVAVAGGMLAVGVIYAFSNVGGGPTIWTTLIPAAIASAALAFLWCLIQLIGSTLSDDITIDRDIAGALRLSGALLGCGLILGRAAGGDWLSWDQTWNDMLYFGWPAVLLAVIAGFVHRSLRPTPARLQLPVMTHGLAWGAVFVLFGIVSVALTPHGFDPSKW
jgi:uncharacterized membrane protein YjfL (UPF0719 family)